MRHAVYFAAATIAVAMNAGCSRTVARLSPAPGTSVVGGPGQGATTTTAGVRVTARVEAWQWGPDNLNETVTPILLELQNDAGEPVIVRYNRISLVDSQGHRFHVMPPYDIDGTVTTAEQIENPFYGLNGFAVAPYLSPWYPRLVRYDGDFVYDGSYYSPYLTRYRRISLPTVDMVQRALPEGVLSPAGRIAGFVYFEALDRDAGTVTLNVELLSARTGALLGTAQLPFVAR